MQAFLKKAKIKLDLVSDVDMLSIVEKVIRGGICYSSYWDAKANDKYLKDYDKSKELSYIQYWNVNNIYGWPMLQKLVVNTFEWIKDTSQFNEDFIKKTIMKKVMKGIFLKFGFIILKHYMNFIMIYHLYQKKWKLKISKSL